MSTSKRKKEMKEAAMKAASAKSKYEKNVSKRVKKEFSEYVPKEPFRRETPQYESLKTKEFNTGLNEVDRYTGDLIIGIGTLHKSNMVPVMRGTSEAKDIARMRR